jgi:lipopolysaccharide biosynthesis glycosyltransferase
MLRIFIGYDPRQPIAYNVLQFSIMRRASVPVSITPLVKETLPPINRPGLTPFTWSRFLVPYLCNYEGWALFLDTDMMVRDDIANLFKLIDPQYSVMVSKNALAFEWASAILFNCAKCKILTPEFINETKVGLHNMAWLPEQEVGGFPGEWNHLVGYDEERDDARLIHYTQGIPWFPETAKCEYADLYHREWQAFVHTESWKTLMGNSVHTCEINGELLPKFHLKKVAHG